MTLLLNILLTLFVAFTACRYTLAIFNVRYADIIAGVFAVLVVIFVRLSL